MSLTAMNALVASRSSAHNLSGKCAAHSLPRGMSTTYSISNGGPQDSAEWTADTPRVAAKARADVIQRGRDPSVRLIVMSYFWLPSFSSRIV